MGPPPWAWGLLFGNMLRARRARRGDVRAGILMLLAEQPRNGYQIMQELEQRSSGTWRPSSGSIYPALSLLEDEGLVKEEKGNVGRSFHLSERGRGYVAKHKGQLGAAWQSAIDASPRDGAGERWEVMLAIRPVANAVMQVVQSGTAEQQAAARRVLAETRRALYRILAEAPLDDEDADEAEPSGARGRTEPAEGRVRGRPSDREKERGAPRAAAPREGSNDRRPVRREDGGK
jgi:DNA-binding PadR family transcriptional regulator